MKGINQVHYIGSITQNPEMKYTPNGLAILELTVAGKELLTKSDGTPGTNVFYNRCKCFGKYAEALADNLQKGDVVNLWGRLEHRVWDQDGEKRSTVETVIETIHTLSGNFVIEDDRRGQPVLKDGFNRVTLGGNLTRDAEHRYLPTGNSVTRLTLAVSERYGAKAADEKVGYFDLQGWGELAESLAEGSKGQGVIGVGRVLNDAWEGKDGNKHYGTKVELERAHFVAAGRRPVAAQPTQTSTRAALPAPPIVDETFPPEEDLPF